MTTRSTNPPISKVPKEQRHEPTGRPPVPPAPPGCTYDGICEKDTHKPAPRTPKNQALNAHPTNSRYS